MPAGNALSAETAEIIFFAVAAVMWAVWLVGTWFALSRLRPPKARGVLPDDPEARDVLTGEAEIAGEAETVSKKIAEQIISSASFGGVSGIKITERTRERIAFEKIRGGGRMPVFDSGLITLVSSGDRVRVRYAVSQRRFSRIMRIVTYLVCFLYGGIFMIGAPVLIWKYVVHSDNPAVRMQVFQTLQMVHGVWPPFLVGFLGSRLRKATSGFFETLLANIAHVL